MAYSTINERFKIIADKLFGGNITAMSKGTFISRTTLNSIVGEKGVSPGYDIIRRIAAMKNSRAFLLKRCTFSKENIIFAKNT